MARVAAMLADPARSRMLSYLLAGHYASAGELARVADVGASTASAHLARLLDGGLVCCEPRGRHRYYKLADAEVAHALEALALVAERGTHGRRWAAPGADRLRHARCCYGHLAGRLGVALHDLLLRERLLAPVDVGRRLGLTASGLQWLRELGCRPQPSRAMAYGCLDWSERRDHLAGPLAVDLLDHFIAQGWLLRDPAGGAQGRAQRSRALSVTPRGAQMLLPRLGLQEAGAERLPAAGSGSDAIRA